MLSGSEISQIWSGWDLQWMADMVEPTVSSGAAAALLNDLEHELDYADDKPLPVGAPLKLSTAAIEYIEAVSAAYHRLILQVIHMHANDDRVKSIIGTPAELMADLRSAEQGMQPHLDLMRIDFLPQQDGSLRILETNANCPGGLLFAGHTTRAWRSQLGDGFPPPFPLEHPDWLYNWLIAAAGQSPDTVALFRIPGGNRLELDLYAEVLSRFGVHVFEASPTEVTFNGFRPRVCACDVSVGYLKVGMQDFLRLRPQEDDFVSAVRSGRLFVQNGQRARWVGDSKLCLAVLSDPDLADLFDSADYSLVRPLVPWTRNLALCSDDTVALVATHHSDFVIKHPLDTRGRGVFIGADMDPAGWQRVVALGVAGGWVVQEMLPTTSLPAAWNPNGGDALHHDLAVVVAGGRMAGALARSSTARKLNVAGNGRFHPVLMG